MSWYVPFNQLSIKQRSVLDGISNQLSKPHWIQGFAGTGKTVVISHLIERVAADHPRASLCFITFTHALKDLVSTGFHGPVAKRIDIKTHTQFLTDRETYDYVFLDEVQDIKPSELTRIKALAEHLYVAGDSDQRIYEEGSKEEDILRTVQPVAWKLLEIFRLTKLLRDVAISILPKARIVEGSDAVKTANVSIRLIPFQNEKTEVEWIWDEAIRRSRPGDPSVILFPTHDSIAEFSRNLSSRLDIDPPPKPKYVRGRRDYTDFNEHWADNDTPLVYLGNSFGSFNESETKPLVYFMTFHSSKGLDFKNVFIPNLNSDTTLIARQALEKDPDIDRRLLFVAVTRSRENLFLSFNSKKPHPYVANLPKAVITEVDARKKSNSSKEDFF
jgi:hypothetical protein